MRLFCCILLAAVNIAAPRISLTAPTEAREKATVAESLQRRTSVRWQGISLRDALCRVSETQALPVHIDRRIDAQRLIDLKADSQLLHDLLADLARQSDARILPLPTLVYVGPSEVVAELPTLLELSHEQVRLAPAATQQRLKSPQLLSWPRLSTPQQVVGNLARRTGMEIIGLERLPHDLWDAGNLPADSAANQLTLLLAEFDYTWRFEKRGNKLLIVPIEHPVRISRTYDWRGVTAARLQQVAAEIPAANVRMANGKVVVDGPIEEHDKLAAILSKFPRSPRNGRQSTRRAPEKKLYSLRLEGQPAGALLRELARQLKLELRVDQNAKQSLIIPISIDVKQVELETLLAKVSDLAGVQIVATETELQVMSR